jgi:serine/threonine protein kinase
MVRLSADSTEEMIGLLAPPQEADEVGRLGSYRLLRVLGSGAAGVVFLAEDVHLRRPVALKVMKPRPERDNETRERFLREARAAALLDHEHVVSVYQTGEDRGLTFLAMKLLEGETLAARLDREGQLLIHEVLRIGREIALGLAAAHEKGLVHRDVKPANVFLERTSVPGEGRVKIVDFGLARSGEDVQLTRTGTIMGTPAYMSPEQGRGARVDYRSDLFSLGCVLYRMCAGRTPFQADDTMGLLMALASEDPPPLQSLNPNVPDKLVGLISRLLAKRPEGRPQSAEGVAAALAVLQEEAAHNAAQMSLPAREKADRPFWVTLVQMVLLAGLGWGIFWYGPAAARTAQQWASRWIDDVNKAGERR